MVGPQKSSVLGPHEHCIYQEVPSCRVTTQSGLCIWIGIFLGKTLDIAVSSINPNAQPFLGSATGWDISCMTTPKAQNGPQEL